MATKTTPKPPVENVPANFPQEAIEAIEAAKEAVVNRPAEPSHTARTPIPEAPYSITFKLQGPNRYADMLVTARAATAKELALSLAALMDQFIPVADEIGYSLPEPDPEPVAAQWPPAGAINGNGNGAGAGNPAYADPSGDYAGQPAGFPRPANWQPPAVPQAPATPWGNGAVNGAGAGPTTSGNGTTRGSFVLNRLVVATTRSGARQLQAFGPNGEKCTTGLSPDIMAQKCAALGLTAAHFQVTGVELYNLSTMPNAPRAMVHWYQKGDTRYKDLDKLELVQAQQ